MSGITLQWLQSGPMIDFLQYSAEIGEIPHIATGTVLWRLEIPAAIAALGLILLSVRAVRRRQKRGESAVTEELPVAEVQASLGGLRTLEEIVCCESKEIIP